jgi:hypothetical protein
MIFAKHEKTHLRYYRAVAKRNDSYAGHRGAGKTMRMCGGMFFVNNEWFNRTKRERNAWLKKLHKTKIYDRVFDEEMLYEICRKSSLMVPTVRAHFASGKPFNMKYRDCHLGDFRYPKRFKDREKMKYLIPPETIKDLKRLFKEEGYQKAEKVACKHSIVDTLVKRMHKYVKSR